MTLHFVPSYVPALFGLVIGAAGGYVIAARGRVPAWDARFTLPLLLGAAVAHLLLIPVVEPARQIMFGLYFVALAVTFAVALAGIGAWKIGAVLFPVGSVLGYFYFAMGAHQVDFIGLAVKLVEVGVIFAALRSTVAAARVPTTG